MTTNNRDYVREYAKNKYKNDIKYANYTKKMAKIRVRALIILRNKHKKEFTKIYRNLLKGEK